MIALNVTKFRKLIEKKKVTKSQVAMKLKVDRSYISKLEKGAVIPSLEKALALSKYFDCPVNELFKPIAVGK